MKAVYGLYPDGQSAQQAFNRLRAAGVATGDITVHHGSADGGVRVRQPRQGDIDVVVRLSGRAHRYVRRRLACRG